MTTRAPSSAVRSNIRLRDYALAERFVFDYARYPELPSDGPLYRALLSARAANLAVLARALRQPWEPEMVEAWRRRTAAEALIRTARTTSAVRQIVRQTVAWVAARPRESTARRRGTATGRAGASGDREPPPDDPARHRRLIRQSWPFAPARPLLGTLVQ